MPHRLIICLVIEKNVREIEEKNTIEEKVRNLSVFAKGTETGTQLESPSTEKKVTARLNRLIHLILCPFKDGASGSVYAGLSNFLFNTSLLKAYKNFLSISGHLRELNDNISSAARQRNA